MIAELVITGAVVAGIVVHMWRLARLRTHTGKQDWE